MITLHPGSNQNMDTPSHRLEATKLRLQNVLSELNAPMSTIRVISSISQGLSQREKMVLQEALDRLEDLRKEMSSIKRL